MRDKIKDNLYFQKYLELNQLLIEKGHNMLSNGNVIESQLDSFKHSIYAKYVGEVIAKYSAGYSIAEVKIAFEKLLRVIKNYWSNQNVLLSNENKRYQQYILPAYDDMLWMLSLGYLLEISLMEYEILVNQIDTNGIKDYLFEFIISAKIKNRLLIENESYQDFFGIPLAFDKIRKAINESDKNKAEKLIKEYVVKDWYKNHKDAGWYNSHKSKHEVYVGYWSFETAAIVKIMGLDDSSFRDCPYYPKDLI